jgi:TadE-like protein
MRRRRRSAGRGQALVEFALVFPIFILILVAVFDVGRLVFTYNSLTNAAREGARLAIVNQDKTAVVTRVEEIAFGNPLSNGATPDDVVSFRESKPNADPLANAECTASKIAVGCIAVVTPKSDWSAITPIIGRIIGPIQLVGRSELPVELTCPNPDIPSYASSTSCPVR